MTGSPHARPTQAGAEGDAAPAYTPCARLLFQVPRHACDSQGTALTIAAARWANHGGRGWMTPVDEHVVICRLAGVGSVTRLQGGRHERKQVRTGSFSVVPAGFTTGWVVDDEDETLHLYLRAAGIDAFAERHPELRPQQELRPLFGASDPWLDAFFGMLRAEIVSVDGGLMPFALFVSHVEHLLLRHLLRRDATAPLPSSGDRVSPLRPFLLARVKDLVMADLGQDVSLRRLADEVHLSPDHFLRAFRAAVGVTPYRWVNQQRLDAAASRLEAGEHDIAELARSLGWRSASHFAAQFRARFGAAPSAYRRAWRGPATRAEGG